MIQKTPAHLKIITASAGAGKTHALTGEYLRLALSEPGNFRHIQAVTFTNKATAEMKERILEELNILAHTPQESAFLNDIRSELHLSETELQRQAESTLRCIMADYSAFRIKTIDAFFQEVIRTFARELNLSGRYRVEMQNDEILDSAATRLLDSINESGDGEKTAQQSEIRKWLKEMALEQISEGESHNLKGELLRLGKEIFTEAYQRNDRQKDFAQKIGDLKRDCHDIIHQYEKKRLGIAAEIWEIVTQNHIEDTINHYLKNALYKAVENKGFDNMKRLWDTGKQLYEGKMLTPEDICPKSRKNLSAVSQAIAEGLTDKIKDYYAHSYEGFARYRSAGCILNDLNTFALINALQEQVDALCREQEISMISGSSQFIHRIIEGSSVPFLYERLGTRIHHHMLDEFQDTSQMQYDNFRPLLEDGLAQNSDSLVVGDAKQSIYRFRNAESTLLTQTVPQDFSAYQEKQDLLYNWRSRPEVIHFNNELFSMLPGQLDQELGINLLRSTYSPVKQNIPSSSAQKRGGAVVIHTLPPRKNEKKSVSEDEELPNDVADERMNDLCATIDNLLERGCPASDIAILVNTAREAGQVADALIEYSHRPNGKSIGILSEEALQLYNAASVRLVIAALRFIAEGLRPDEKNAHCPISMTPAGICLGEAYRAISTQSSSVTLTLEEYRHIASFANLNLFEMVEAIIHHFNALITSDEWSYLLALQDQVLQAQNDRSLDLKGFLELWESRLKTVTIPPESSNDAVHLITIHKSKGLGFPVVLIPFPGRKENYRAVNYVWCDLSAFDNAYPYKLPLAYKASLYGSDFKTDYQTEQGKRMLDELNIFYVAVTRAKRELHLWVCHPDDVKDTHTEGYWFESPPSVSIIDHIAKAIHQMPTDLYHAHKATADISLLNLPAYTSGNDDKVASPIHIEHIASAPNHANISIVREGREFFTDNSSCQYGRAMHRILQQIETAENLPTAITQAVSAGWVGHDQAETLLQELNRMLHSDERVASWYDGTSHWLNEQTIVAADIEGSRRPDRILLHPDGSASVIDYKFGNRFSKSHFTQVQEYMQLLKRMGYSPVHGYLWYVTLSEVRSISPLSSPKD